MRWEGKEASPWKVKMFLQGYTHTHTHTHTHSTFGWPLTAQLRAAA